MEKQTCKARGRDKAKASAIRLYIGQASPSSSFLKAWTKAGNDEAESKDLTRMQAGEEHTDVEHIPL